LGFAHALAQVRFSVHMGLYPDETAALCQWHLPQTHYLETWSDAKAYDGTVSIIQPLIAPLYDGMNVHALMAYIVEEAHREPLDLVRETWEKRPHGPDFEVFWERALTEGMVAGSAEKIVKLAPKSVFSWPKPLETKQAPGTLELVFRRDASVYDGRFANNGWLQELPRPLSKLTWDNAAWLSPTTAHRLGLETRDVVILTLQGRQLKTAIMVMPGQCDDVVTLQLGYGRTKAGRVGDGCGFNAYQLRSANAPWRAQGLGLQKTTEQYTLAHTQWHHSMEGRDLVREATLEEFIRQPDFVHAKEEPLSTLYQAFKYEGHAWGMAIDLNACTGCNACVVACQSENNIPIVGKEQVDFGREMHWIRVDSYNKGDASNPQTMFQPVPCMQCENAPCEAVCPPGATVHDDEGLNVMVYNRCIGTRYCSNNCPYKVRRFNFLQFADDETESLKPLRNPDVSVRERGVMEKCTYCTQRINEARIGAQEENRSLRDGEIKTACQQTCPTNAITFGDLSDPNSAVSRLKAEPLNYAMLGELNTRPRTTYLGKLRNPNPALSRE
jgi:Fe-S-cluster-containing dehydrogenase component